MDKLSYTPNPIYNEVAMRLLIGFVLLVAIQTLLGAQTKPQTEWQLVWSDEFDGPANSPPDPSKWTYDTGAGGWGNNELETYTNSTANSHLDGNGNLVIHIDRNLTSARLKTQGLFTFTYGKVEARMKIPRGQGLWPAFWLLGANINAVGWPQCGEIDIMENIGKEPTIIHGTVHGPAAQGGATDVGGSHSLSGSPVFADDFHIYGVQWLPGSVLFTVDDDTYFYVDTTAYQNQWVFNTPFFIILNVAVGGDWPGPPDSTTVFPQDMIVDYVHVSQAAPVVNAVVDAGVFVTAVAPGGLATIFGLNLADTQNQSPFDAAHGVFSTNSFGTQVLVDGVQAPLTYVDPNQINFQIPWETPVGKPVTVQVVRKGIAGNSFTITPAAAAPSAFVGYRNQVILDCILTSCTLWGNGFGPTAPAQKDGTPSPSGLSPIVSGDCQLTFGNVSAKISYCGGAPGQIIDQLNFTYPPSAGQNGVLTVGGSSITLGFPEL